MPDDLAARLLVLDTGPLITLAVAGSLDYLLYPGVPIYVPDAVLYEATRDSGALEPIPSSYIRHVGSSL